MTDHNPTPAPQADSSTSSSVPSTPGRCLRGALISSGLAFAMYSLTQSMIQVLAGVPIPTKSTFAANISVAVRTLIVGGCTLATAIFAFATVGLLALSVQLLIRQKQQQ
jgi:hypothetical protein